MTRVLVIGVRGQTGREVAAQLAGRDGVTVRGTARDPRGIEQPGVEPVGFDWQQPATWDGALAGGFDAIYLVRPEIEDAEPRIEQLIARAGDARVVLLSEIAAETLPASDWVAGVEHAAQTAAHWTIVRPASFYQLLTDERYLLESIRDAGEIAFPTGDGVNGFVDVRDIAAVVVEALLEDGHAGRAYALTGPEAVTFAEVARRLAAAVGHPVRHTDPPLEDAVASFEAAGLEGWFVAYLRGASERVRDGRYGRLSADVERVTGRPPRSLDAFIAEHADSWRRIT
ncbi:NAD(P)H-binding protein [Conexibacter woesei]|uniref:NAD(P)-binding domain-containing protein n=1 Tax=Conexibacter woesei (strain DSM 14684 / CCUG 47730 / CIP 108061 / JCM 11494 / NBRC 100937 / ID131577) TaxID=469383 RepID=D3F4I0_CONWI|nr:NAD(P)H-binding protein [Conexibacter woesei]ADB52437.1 conserved hypothetical protein [Conexibacter woesei DSM 14684]